MADKHFSHGERVNTPNGPGTLTGQVDSTRDGKDWLRVEVVLDNNPFPWPRAWYYKNELVFKELKA